MASQPQFIPLNHSLHSFTQQYALYTGVRYFHAFLHWSPYQHEHVIPKIII